MSPRTLLIPLSALLMGISSWGISPYISTTLSILSTLLVTFIFKTQSLSYISALGFGFVLSFTQFHWVKDVFILFTNKSETTGLFFSLSMYIWSSLQFALLILIYRKLKKIKQLNSPLTLPLSWVLSEIIFPKFIPWSQGATLSSLTPFIKIADLGGVCLVTFLLFLTCSLFVESIYEAKNSLTLPRKKLLSLSCTIFLPMLYTHLKNNHLITLETKSKKISVTFIQPNLNPATDFTFENLSNRDALAKDLTSLALSRTSKQPDLIIWPESAVGHTFYEEENFLPITDKRHPYPNINTPLLFGGQVQIGKTYNESTKFYNAALLLLPNGELKQDYYKEILFPFSEQTPFGSFLPFIDNLFSPLENYKKAENNKTKSISLGLNTLAVRICFEDIWPNLYRNNILRDGAEILISISNDGWFSKTMAMHQHHMLATWRALENDRYLLRIGNNGITELISPRGKVIESFKSNLPLSGSLLDIPLIKKVGFYTRHGTLASLFTIGVYTILTILILRTRDLEQG